MPPAIPIIATLGAEALGSIGGSLAAGAIGEGTADVGLGLTGADIGAGLGGGLASGITSGLISKNPIDGLIGGVTGAIGGPGVANGIGNLATDVGANLGLPQQAASAAAATPAATPAAAATATPPATGPAGPAGGAAPAAATASGVSPAVAAGSAAAPVDPTSAQGVLSNSGSPAFGTAPSATTASSPTGVLSQMGSGPFGNVAAAPATLSAQPVTPPAAGSLNYDVTQGLPPGPPAGQLSLGTSAVPVGQNAAQPNYTDALINDPSSGQNWLNFAKNNGSAIAGGLGLGYDLLNQGNVKGLGAVEGAAANAQKTSAELSSYINTGQLPPGYQAAMDQATQAAKAQLRSKYASLGMSGSTAEAQDIANVDVQAVAAQAQVAGQLLQSGISESGVASSLLQSIVGINQQQDSETQAAISAFASSLGGAQPLYLNLNGLQPQGH